VPAFRRLFAVVVAAVVVLAAPAAAQAKAAKKVPVCANTDVLPTPQNAELVRAAVLCLHNRLRAQNGLPLLKDNAKLRKAADGHAGEMVDEGYFAHDSSNGDSFVDRVLRAGYAKRSDGWSLGENLAWGTGDESTPDGVMAAWMASPGHRANVLKRSYRELGVGIRLGVPSDSGVGATFTADFGVKA
jgi:uncharacterized protein YkwD